MACLGPFPRRAAQKGICSERQPRHSCYGVEGVAKLVRDLHPPIAAGLQLAVQALENLAGGNCRFLPRRLPVRQFFPISSGSERSRSMSCGSDPMTNSNALLMSFSDSDMDAPDAFSQNGQFKSHQVLAESGDTISLVYFPTTCVISLVVALSSGELIETAMVGRDGVVDRRIRDVRID